MHTGLIRIDVCELGLSKMKGEGGHDLVPLVDSPVKIKSTT